MSKKKRQRKYGAEDQDAPANSSEMTRFYWVLGIVAVLGVAIVGYQVGSSALGDTVTEPITIQGLDDPARLMEIARGIEMGDPNAEITIIEFADFQCPACQAFAAQVKPLVEVEFVQTGIAKFTFYTFPLVAMHPNAFLAARASYCADDQGRFWDYHDVLFRNQTRWAGQQNPARAFESYATDLGLDRREFAECLRSDRHAEVITANMELARQMQVPGTPTVIVGRGRGMPQRVENNIEGIRAGVAALRGAG